MNQTETNQTDILKRLADRLEEPPIIDFQAFFDKREGVWEHECQKVAASLSKFGILYVKDPRVDHSMNEDYINMVERYFERQGERFYKGEELEDCHPELSYQTGVTPESLEKARDHGELLKRIPKDH